MQIYTEMSGLGNYGVCTVIPRELLSDTVKKILQMDSKFRGGEWENPEFEEHSRRAMGIESSLIPIPDEEGVKEETIRLSWHPGKLPEAMRSHSLLVRTYLTFQGKVCPSQTEDSALQLDCARTQTGWFVHANLGESLWKVIEDDIFSMLSSNINDHLRKWWEDQTGRRTFAQFVTVFPGRDGTTLQIYQPGMDGIWIAGSKNFQIGLGYQLTDHNTLSSRDAFSHVMGLCLIHKYCQPFV